MKNLFGLLLLLTLSLNSFGQISTEKELHGKWKVEEIVKENINPQLLPIIQEFKNLVFYFNENGQFELISNAKYEFIGELIEMAKDTKWTFDEDKLCVDIRPEKDKYSTIGIIIKETNEKTIFHLDETEIKLVMKKIE